MQKWFASALTARYLPRMPGKRDNLKRAFSLDGLKAYLPTVDFSEWRPSLVVIHHCAAPSLAQRPRGFLQQHMDNLERYYEDSLGWSGAPHFFIDEDEAWAFNPLNEPGVHAVSFNKTSLGLEMLGDYDTEDPSAGRGAQVLRMTARVTRVLLDFFRLTPAAIRFHRDDPKTAKTCPGRRVTKEAFLALVEKA